MNTSEKWFKWDPCVDGIVGKYCLTRIDDKLDKLNIFLISKESDQKIKVCFDSVWSYCNSDETSRLHLITELSERHGDDFYTKWSFFKVEDSSYLKWLSEQSST